MPKLVWRVKLVAELEAGVATETEIARFERGEHVGVADLGLRLEEAKQLTAALQAQIVPAQVTGRRVSALVRGLRAILASKGDYPATFRSLFGDVPVRVRRLLVCPCRPRRAEEFRRPRPRRGRGRARTRLRHGPVCGAGPFGKVAALLSELLPMGGARHAGTVRNRTLRVGEAIVQPHRPRSRTPAAQPAGPVVVGLDGGYVRSRHRREERHFEVIAGKVIDAEGVQHRFAFARNGQARLRGVQAGARRGWGGRGYACDGAVRRRCRAVAAAARGAAGYNNRAGLVARRGALRTRAADRPRPRCAARPTLAWPMRRSATGAGEVAPVARPLAGMPAQARGAAPLDASAAMT